MVIGKAPEIGTENMPGAIVEIVPFPGFGLIVHGLFANCARRNAVAEEIDRWQLLVAGSSPLDRVARVGRHVNVP